MKSSSGENCFEKIIFYLFSFQCEKQLCHLKIFKTKYDRAYNIPEWEQQQRCSVLCTGFSQLRETRPLFTIFMLPKFPFDWMLAKMCNSKIPKRFDTGHSFKNATTAASNRRNPWRWIRSPQGNTSSKMGRRPAPRIECGGAPVPGNKPFGPFPVEFFDCMCGFKHGRKFVTFAVHPSDDEFGLEQNQSSFYKIVQKKISSNRKKI